MLAALPSFEVAQSRKNETAPKVLKRTSSLSSNKVILLLIRGGRSQDWEENLAFAAHLHCSEHVQSEDADRMLLLSSNTSTRASNALLSPKY